MTLEDVVDRIRGEWREAKVWAFGELKSPQAGVRDEDALIRRTSEAQAARAFLESPIVTGFMAKQEAKLLEVMLALPTEDDAGRYRMTVAVQSIRQLRKYLAAATQDGRLAEAELERLRNGRRNFF